MESCGARNVSGQERFLKKGQFDKQLIWSTQRKGPQGNISENFPRYPYKTAFAMKI